MAGHVVPIHLPRVRLVDVFALFEATTEETPTLQERTSEETAQAVAAAGKPPAPQPQPSAEVEKKINDWYTDRVKLRSLQVRAGIPGEP